LIAHALQSEGNQNGEVMDAQVLIVGAGPVGLTMAIELGRRGIEVALVDKRPGFGKLPKMERCNARTMENFRRMGIADEIRAAGLDNDMPMDVFICQATLQRPPIVHHAYPSVRRLQADYRAVHDGTTAAEPYQLISQYTLEPLLRDVAAELPGVAVRFDQEVTGFEQDREGVVTTLRSASGEEQRIASRYLVGCDGAASVVRGRLGFELQGDSLLEMRQALFRSEELFDAIPIGKGRHYHFADDVNSFIIVQDDKRHFSLHATVSTDEEMPALFRRLIGVDVPFETLYIGRWTQRLMVTSGMQQGRVFLAGDSAHLVIPTGGLGMNTGHADAVDLAWKLAAAVAGWAGDQLLASYSAERRPIAVRNVAASRKAAAGRRRWRAEWRPEIAEDSPAGIEARARLKEVADVEQRWSNDLYGIELGYRYLHSPVIAYEPGEDRDLEDPLDFEYVPQAVPGARLPHVWLADGRPIQDALAREYTLIVVGEAGAEGIEELTTAFAEVGAPFRVLRPDSVDAAAVYGPGLLLVRPDLHIVWRGARLPGDVRGLARLVTGHGNEVPAAG